MHRQPEAELGFEPVLGRLGIPHCSLAPKSAHRGSTVPLDALS